MDKHEVEDECRPGDVASRLAGSGTVPFPFLLLRTGHCAAALSERSSGRLVHRIMSSHILDFIRNLSVHPFPTLTLIRLCLAHLTSLCLAR